MVQHGPDGEQGLIGLELDRVEKVVTVGDQEPDREEGERGRPISVARTIMHTPMHQIT